MLTHLAIPIEKKELAGSGKKKKKLCPPHHRLAPWESQTTMSKRAYLKGCKLTMIGQATARASSEANPLKQDHAKQSNAKPVGARQNAIVPTTAPWSF